MISVPDAACDSEVPPEHSQGTEPKDSLVLKPWGVKPWLPQETDRVRPSCPWWCVSGPSPTHSYRASGTLRFLYVSLLLS